MPTMRSAVWSEQRELRIREDPTPEPRAEEVLLQVNAVGICGSDLHWLRGEFPPVPGRRPGHEIGATVSGVGGGVTRVREGEVVGVEPIRRCQQCRYCRSGQYQVCADKQLLGVGADGGLGEYLVVPEYMLYPAPAGIDPELTALAEPLACCVHGYEKAGLRDGETVLVLGAGSIGLAALLVARSYGAQVVITARYPHQQEAARRLGAAEVLGDDEAGAARLQEFAADGAVDVVVEAVGGRAETIAQAVDVVRPLGRVIVLGVFTSPTVGLNPFPLLLKEVSIVGAVTYGAPGARAEYELALELLPGFPEEARSLITHRFALHDVNAGFATALDKRSQSIKVQIAPNARGGGHG